MKLPPKEKIYEAYSAIGAGRVALSANSAKVKSSDGSREYTVQWDGDVYTSTDPATYWQAYPGYPVLAVWMLQGYLPYDADVCKSMKDIPWHTLNNTFKHKYAEAWDAVKESLPDLEKIEDLGKAGNERIAELPFVLKRSLKSKK